ncbi:MAG: hypothetical protein WBV22_11610 [Anaerolineaceae bacterium]
MIWYLPFDPVSPPATKPGKVPEFDRLLESANKNWIFLFEHDITITATDIHGTNKRVVFDVGDTTQNDPSFSMSDCIIYPTSVSPDGRYLTLDIYNYRDSKALCHSTRFNFFLINTITSEVFEIPAIIDGFDYDSLGHIHWLSPDVFLVEIHRYYLKSDEKPEEIVFLRYDLKKPSQFKLIDLDGSYYFLTIKQDPNVILYDLDTSIGDIPLSIDINGKRDATSEETAFFEKCIDHWWWEDNCEQNLLTDSIASIRVESVTDNAVDCILFDCGYFYRNWSRDYI